MPSAGRRIAIALLLTLLAPTFTALAGDACYTPKGAERKAILDTLRGPVAAELQQSVEFVVTKFRVCWKSSPAWAFVDARPQRPGGGRINWEQTGHIDCDPSAEGLLRQATPAGGWKVVESVVCPSDVPWAAWSDQHGAPPELFE